MTHTEDLHRIEINHLRQMLRSVKEENENLKDTIETLQAKNETLQAKNQLYLQQLESEYRKSKV
jgi:BMFP domain-containing protein YqiC